MWLRRVAIGVNALGTTASGAGILPGALVYPALAQAASERAVGGLGRVALDATLCFAPLAVPALVVLGAIGLRTAWERAPESAGLNGLACVGWAALAASLATVVGASW
jgi:hypothetical protein